MTGEQGAAIDYSAWQRSDDAVRWAREGAPRQRAVAFFFERGDGGRGARARALHLQCARADLAENADRRL